MALIRVNGGASASLSPITVHIGSSNGNSYMYLKGFFDVGYTKIKCTVISAGAAEMRDPTSAAGTAMTLNTDYNITGTATQAVMCTGAGSDCTFVIS